MKKASIITMQYVDNTGSVLQTYATQKIIERYGYQGEILNYVRESCTYETLKAKAFQRYRSRKDIFAWYPLAKLLQLRWSHIYLKKKRQFEPFRKKYFNMSAAYHTLSELKDHPPQADVYITGSDQVWNSIWNEGVLPEYFLAYAPEDSPKVSIAASIGRTEISDREIELIRPYLKKYKALSVREESAVRILNKCGRPDAVQILDPTLLLSAETWAETFGLQKKAEDYILVYQLNSNPDMLRFTEKLSRDHDNMKVVVISEKSRCKDLACRYQQKSGASVEEFLQLFYCARFVVTDSFHGTAFSCNFNRNIFAFYPERFSTRLESALSLFHIEKRHVSEDLDWRHYPSIDFNLVNDVLNKERQRADAYLCTALTDIDEKSAT